MEKELRIFKTGLGAYAEKAEIGRGGSGIVYSATNEDESLVAVKVLDGKNATREKRKRFKNEIFFCFRTRHPGIIQVLDYGVTVQDGSDALFFVMPLYPQTLRKAMSGQLQPREAIHLFLSLLDGIEAAHLLGVVHRDLKPENVFVNADGQSVVVGDFGIAHFHENELVTSVETRPGIRMANFLYAAPEQRVRGRSVDRRADIFALGLILNELFTGEVCQGSNCRTVASAVPDLAYIDELVSVMTSQQPEDRPTTIDDVKMRLASLGQQFIQRQKLDRLEQAVVPATEVDDPLVQHPVRIVNLRVEEAGVVLLLSQEPNARWKTLFRQVPGCSFHLINDFRTFPITRNTITIPPRADGQQILIDQVKDGVARTNQDYREWVAEETRLQAEEDRRRRMDEIKEKKRRLALLTSLKI
jgi:serine/threonine protein kinase